MWSQNCDDCGPERLVLWVATHIRRQRTFQEHRSGMLGFPTICLNLEAFLHGIY